MSTLPTKNIATPQGGAIWKHSHPVFEGLCSNLQSLHHCVVFSMFRYNSSKYNTWRIWLILHDHKKHTEVLYCIQTLHDCSWFLKVSLKVHFCEEAAKCWRFPIVSHSSHKYHALTRCCKYSSLAQHWLTPGVDPDPGIVLINPLPLRNRAKKSNSVLKLQKSVSNWKSKNWGTLSWKYHKLLNYLY